MTPQAGNRAIGYIRVSTEEQAREGVSLENQKQKIVAYCDIYGLNLVEIIEDAGQSAKSINRDGMQRLMEIIGKRTAEINCIVTYKLDRLFRNAEEALRYSSHWDKKGIALCSVVEQLDTKSAMGKFFFTINASSSNFIPRAIFFLSAPPEQATITRFSCL